MSHIQREDEEGIDNRGWGRPVEERQHEESAKRFVVGLAPFGANVDVQSQIINAKENPAPAPKMDTIDVATYKKFEVVREGALEPLKRKESGAQDAQWNPGTDQVSQVNAAFFGKIVPNTWRKQFSIRYFA